MTKKEIKESIKAGLIKYERLVDIDVWDCFGTQDYVTAIVITTFHTVWKKTYSIDKERNVLNYVDSEIMK